MLPAAIRTELAHHLERVLAQHERDLELGAGWVELPAALALKHPSAGRAWAWQWVVNRGPAGVRSPADLIGPP